MVEFFPPEMCCFQPESQKKKTVPVFFPLQTWAEECRGCALKCACCTNNYILQFPLWELLFSVLNRTPPIPTAHPPHWETVNLLFPLWLKNMHTQNRLVTASATCFHKGLCHMLARHETSEETVCGLLDFCTLAETCTVQMWKKQKHAEVL